jgi:uncharacterized membrane protein
MEEVVKQIALPIALGAESVAILVVTYGVIQALWGLLKSGARKQVRGARKQVWLGLGVWLLLGLEFELAADIVRSAISPEWRDIGQLAAIAVVRTFLNYFLEKDLEKYAEPETSAS